MPSCTTDMEKGDFGDGADRGDVNASEFSRDFADMFHAADGALHHQLYEFSQGPAARHGQQLGANFQEGCFPFPPYPAGSASMAAPFRHLPEKTLQSTTVTNSVDHRIGPDNGPHLGPNQVASHHGSHNQRSQFNLAASPAALLAQPTSMGVGGCIPRYLRSTDHTSNLARASTFQYAPAKSSFVYTTPESAYIPRPREFSGYEAPCSLNNLKRAAGCEMTSLQPLHRGKSQKVMSVPDHGVLKSKRPPHQVEHSIRERLRRDDMTSKFRKLESLIPPRPKRDRSTIVEDSIQYLKNLHHRLQGLQQKRSEMKSSRSTSSFSGGLTTDTLKQSNAPAPCNVTVDAFVKKSSSSSRPGNKALDNIVSTSWSQSNDGIALAKTSFEKVEVHLDLPHEIVIQITCRPHGHIQSQILDALERLRMDVVRCSITKLRGRIVCFVVVKLRVMADPPITSNDVIRALKRAVAAQADL